MPEAADSQPSLHDRRLDFTLEVPLPPSHAGIPPVIHFAAGVGTAVLAVALSAVMQPASSVLLASLLLAGDVFLGHRRNAPARDIGLAVVALLTFVGLGGLALVGLAALLIALVVVLS